MRGLSLIIEIWLLNLACLLMRTIACFISYNYSGYLNFIKDPISHVLLLFLVHVLLLSYYIFDFLPHCDKNML